MSRRVSGILALGLAAGLLGRTSAAQDPNPPAFAREGPAAEAAPSEAPQYLFLDGPIDPETLRQRLQHPDFVLMRGEDYARLRATQAATAEKPPAAVVEAVALRGEVGPDLAQITASFEVRLRDEGPAWVPLRLASLIVRRAAEGGIDRPLRADAAGGWDVELRGVGMHRVELDLVVPVRRDSDGRSLDIAIPAAASTGIDLDMPDGTEAVQAGGGPVVPVEAGEARRLRLSLTPRERVIIRWRSAGEADEAGPPLLTAQGEITVEIERTTARMRSSWSLRCERGTAHEVAIRLPDAAADHVEAIEVEDVIVPVEGHFDAGQSLLRIPLPQPLRRGEAVRLGLVTRRELREQSGARFVFRGYPIVGAVSQGGIVAIVQGPEVWVSAEPGSGLRPIDPRKELPDSLRARPATVAACRFAEQPFALTLRCDPSPPRVAVGAHTTVTVERDSARITTDLDYRVVRGHLAEVRVGLGQGLQLLEAGPEGTVESYQILDDEGRRQAVLRITPRALAEEAFRIRLLGRQKLSGPGTIPIGLFRPLEEAARGSIVALTSARDVAALLPGTEWPEGVSALESEPPTDWAWPSERPPTAASVLWLRVDPSVEALPLEITPRRRVVEQATRVAASLDARRLEVRQETTLRVRDGTLRRVEVLVPPELEGSWELEGDAVAVRDRLGREPDGSYRYRLQLARELSDALELRFRARVETETERSDDRPREWAVPWVRVREGAPGRLRIELSAEPGLALQARGEGWTEAAASADEPGRTEDQPPARLAWEGPADGPFPTLVARAARVVELPRLLISRLLLRSVDSGDGAVRTSCWLRAERHPGTIALRLPPQSRPLLARAGTLSLTIEPLGGDAYRLVLPATLAGPTTIRLDWQASGRLGGGRGLAPVLLEGAVVEESLWEARLPSSRVLVGVPPGWTDLNRWSFDRYAWRRRPLLPPAALAAWIGLNPARDTLGEALATEQAYLFTRPGAPREPAVWVLPRPVLIGVGSGLVLIVGLAVLLARPSARLTWLCGLGAAWALGVAVEPNAGFLALQSSVVGLVLVGVAALTQRFVERRQPRFVGW